MYIPISPSNSSLRLEIRKKNSDDVHVKYLTFIQNRHNFQKKIHKEKVFMKIFTINLKKLHANS